MNLSYKEAGVDVEAGDQLVDWLQKSPPLSQRLKMKQKNVVGGIGGFAALYRASFRGLKDPTLVTCTDGVGTKVLLASKYKDFSGVGQDLVAMCVNDLICTGGEPLFFLDYYACGKLNLPEAKQFLKGVQKACEKSGILLVGGETAEMPGVYAPDHFDCAGFAVGVVDKKKMLGPHRVKVGDLLLAVGSSGFHSNGYSLLRKVFAEDLDSWRQQLLQPTALYVDLSLSLRKFKGLKALAHITGGGLDNVPRALPKGLSADLQPWKVPAPFLEVKRRAQLSWSDLLCSLNCGIGLVVVVGPKDGEKALRQAQKTGHKAWVMGEVVRQSKKTAPPSWVLNFDEMERINS